MQKEITYFTDDKNLIQEFKRLKRLVKKKGKANIFLFEDEEEGYPERKFITAEIQKPFPDGLVFIAYSSNLDEVLRSIEDYIYFE